MVDLNFKLSVCLGKPIKGAAVVKLGLLFGTSGSQSAKTSSQGKGGCGSVSKVLRFTSTVTVLMGWKKIKSPFNFRLLIREPLGLFNQYAVMLSLQKPLNWLENIKHEKQNTKFNIKKRSSLHYHKILFSNQKQRVFKTQESIKNRETQPLSTVFRCSNTHVHWTVHVLWLGGLIWSRKKKQN